MIGGQSWVLIHQCHSVRGDMVTAVLLQMDDMTLPLWIWVGLCKMWWWMAN